MHMTMTIYIRKLNNVKAQKCGGNMIMALIFFFFIIFFGTVF